MTELQPLRDFREIVNELTNLYRRNSPDTFSVENVERINSQLNSITDNFIRAYNQLVGYRVTTAQYDYEGDAIMQTLNEWSDQLKQAANIHSVLTEHEEPYQIVVKSDNNDNITASKNKHSNYGNNRETFGNDDMYYKLNEMLNASKTAGKHFIKSSILLTTSRPTSTSLNDIKYQIVNDSKQPHETDKTDEPYGKLSDMLYMRNSGWLGTMTENTVNANNPQFYGGGATNDYVRSLWYAYSSIQSLPHSDNNNVADKKPITILDLLFDPLHVIDLSTTDLLLFTYAQKIKNYYEELLQEQLRANARILEQSIRDREAAELMYQQLLTTLDNEQKRAKSLTTLSRDEALKQREQVLQTIGKLHAREELITNRNASLDRLFSEQIWPSPNTERDTRMTARQKREKNRSEYYSSPAYRNFLLTTYLTREKLFLEHLNSVLESRKQNKRLERFRDAVQFRTDTGFDPNNKDDFRAFRDNRNKALEDLYALPYTPADNKI